MGIQAGYTPHQHHWYSRCCHTLCPKLLQSSIPLFLLCCSVHHSASLLPLHCSFLYDRTTSHIVHTCLIMTALSLSLSPHTHTNTQTHTHTHTHIYIHKHAPAQIHTQIPIDTHTHTHTLAQKPTHKQKHTVNTHTHTHTHTPTHWQSINNQSSSHSPLRSTWTSYSSIFRVSTVGYCTVGTLE